MPPRCPSAGRRSGIVVARTSSSWLAVVPPLLPPADPALPARPPLPPPSALCRGRSGVAQVLASREAGSIDDAGWHSLTKCATREAGGCSPPQQGQCTVSRPVSIARVRAASSSPAACVTSETCGEACGELSLSLRSAGEWAGERAVASASREGSGNTAASCCSCRCSSRGILLLLSGVCRAWRARSCCCCLSASRSCACSSCCSKPGGTVGARCLSCWPPLPCCAEMGVQTGGDAVRRFPFSGTPPASSAVVLRAPPRKSSFRAIGVVGATAAFAPPTLPPRR